MFELDKYEQGIEKSFDNDKWQPVKDSENLKAVYSRYALNPYNFDMGNVGFSEKFEHLYPSVIASFKDELEVDL